MRDGELVRDGDAYVLRFERELAHPVEQVWRAVTDRTDLAAWFPSTVDLELKVGSAIVFGNDPNFDVDPELLATSGEVVEVDPMRTFAFTWGDDLLRFELEPTDVGCRMVFTHRLPHRACVNRTVSGWSVCLDSLSASLGDGDAAGDGWREYYRHYAEQYGEAGTIDRDEDSVIIRFERVMPAPAAAVWAALTGPGGYAEGGTVLRALPERVVERASMPGEPGGSVKWQLIPVGDECLLLLTHTTNDAPDTAAALAGWDQVLVALEGALG